MDYIIIDEKTKVKIYITSAVKEFIENWADVTYISPDTKVYKINRIKFTIQAVRN